MITVFPNLLTLSQQAEVEESKDDNKENEDKNHEEDEAEEDGDDEKEDEEEKVSLISGHFLRILKLRIVSCAFLINVNSLYHRPSKPQRNQPDAGLLITTLRMCQMLRVAQAVDQDQRVMGRRS